MRLIIFILLVATGLYSKPEYGLSFPPVQDLLQVSLTTTHMDTLGVSTLRFSDNWKLREATQGTYTWNPLLKRLVALRSAGKNVFLTLESDGPAWSCNLAKRNERSCAVRDTAQFRKFVSDWLDVVEPFVIGVQFGNEWQTSYWYAGTFADFSVSSTIFNQEAGIRGIPSTLGGFSIGTVRFMTACGGGISFYLDDNGNKLYNPKLAIACQSPSNKKMINGTDSVIKATISPTIDMHLYGDVENWGRYVRYFKSKYPVKVLTVTEFGAVSARYEPQGENYRTRKMKAILDTLKNQPIEKALLFQLFENAESTSAFRSYLIDSNLVISPSYQIYKYYK